MKFVVSLTIVYDNPSLKIGNIIVNNIFFSKTIVFLKKNNRKKTVANRFNKNERLHKRLTTLMKYELWDLDRSDSLSLKNQRFTP